MLTEKEKLCAVQAYSKPIVALQCNNLSNYKYFLVYKIVTRQTVRRHDVLEWLTKGSRQTLAIIDSYVVDRSHRQTTLAQTSWLYGKPN